MATDSASDTTAATGDAAVTRSGSPRAPAVPAVPAERAAAGGRLRAIGARLREIDKRKLDIWFYRPLIILAVLLVWEMASTLDPERIFWISKPSSIGADLVERLGSGRFWLDFRTTIVEIALGFSLGAAFGIVTGFILGYYKRAFRILQPIVFGLYSLPRIALVPLFILWFGIGNTSKVAIVISVVFFILLLNTYMGVTSIDRDLINNVRTMGASKNFIFRTIVLPTSAVWILAGARICLSFSLMAAVMAEMVASRAGLGHALMRTSGSFDTTGTFSLLVVLGAFAILMGWGMERLQSRLLRWRASSGDGDRTTGW